AELKSQSGSVSQSAVSHGAPIGAPLSLVLNICSSAREVLEQAAQGQRRGADSGPQPDRVKVVGLPAERRTQPVQRTDEVLGLGAGQRRFPPVSLLVMLPP